MSKQVTIIAVSGGSGSGKTTYARLLQKKLGDENSAILYQDSYYRDQSRNFDYDGGSVNFDHPDALEFPLLESHLIELKKGNSIQVPIYDFATHTRIKKSEHFPLKEYVIVDGILLFSQDPLVEIFDYKIFIDCPEELRYERRLNRDVKERGRTPEGVHNQFYNQVKPMHDQFVEPTKNIADLVVEQGELFESVIDFYKLLLS
ncbi:MAG: uridine kinase [Halobacteriovoraceae bacterium]|nr:uridine kinase [Halobacteriovoraceae bacterium]MCB9095224.1 uridine kinase [Halobacteriovoraceae bacterium]